MQRVILHPDRRSEVSDADRDHILRLLDARSPMARSVIFDSSPREIIYADLQVRPFDASYGRMHFALIALGRAKDERIILEFDSMGEAMGKYRRTVERCEADPLCRQGDREHAWDVTDRLEVPCNFRSA